MDLILWRHAQAVDGTPDIRRKLTRKGQQQAQDMAAYLAPRLPKNTVVWTSEADRSIETAAFLTDHTHVKSELNPDSHYQDILPLLLAQHKTNLLVIGHQPWLGQVWEHCMNGGVQHNDYWTIKKGGFVWLRVQMNLERLDTTLVASLTPAFLNHG
ncbi:MULTISPECIES: SixA phosphatase family protein [Vitreoscilla]|uniref:Histidine phosphatase family protein n=1 Tax=Vitreoscilla stercoraria TaxID=61 RepID=A0ABY4EG10_VITST|nr:MULTISPECIES: histidine phosphatase family protein [Vitreoscilla]AUZ05055.1 hypothetical protein ADP71_14530 [Vitreoscilla sp. C1]UOO93633.1 histidine phosphatase family protein [Vitreoscilla stercoraria]